MLNKLQSNKVIQRILALIMGIIFGFLLQKGGAARYEIILKQLLLEDFTVVKIMMSAVVVGMLGIYAMKSFGLIEFHTKEGSVGKTVFGGLIFGVGFAVLGYCPGTIMAAAGQGNLDAIFGGLSGIIIGAAIYARRHTYLREKILKMGEFGDKTIPELLGINPWLLVIPISFLIIALLYYLEINGL